MSEPLDIRVADLRPGDKQPYGGVMRVFLHVSDVFTYQDILPGYVSHAYTGNQAVAVTFTSYEPGNADDEKRARAATDGTRVIWRADEWIVITREPFVINEMEMI